MTAIIHSLLYIVYLVDIGGPIWSLNSGHLSLNSQVPGLGGKESASPDIRDFEKIAVTGWDLRLSYLGRMKLFNESFVLFFLDTC